MLYLVPTPIGNLDDITKRAIIVLEEVEYIYAEDTRVFLKLISLLGIKVTKNIRSFNLINEKNRGEEIITLLKNKKKVAIVSDAGHPLIADPGFPLVRKALEENIDVIPIAGACSITLALIKSGLQTNTFAFSGFLKIGKNKELIEQLKKIKESDQTQILFLSKHDIEKCGKVLSTHLPEFNCVIIKELTKIHETIYRGKGKDIVNQIPNNERRGEFVLLVEGRKEEPEDRGLINKLYQLSNTDVKLREKAKIISELTSKSSKEVYQDLVNYKSNKKGKED